MKRSFHCLGMRNLFSLILLLLCLMGYLVPAHMASKSDLAININGFAFDLYWEAVKSSPENNIFLSPFSISTVLSMVYLGSKGETAQQMSKILKIEHISEKVHQSLEDYIKLLKVKNDNFTLITANRLYPSREMEIEQKYVTTCSKHYEADIVPTDFVRKASDAENEINSWVEKETKGKIKNLIPSGSLGPLTVLVLVNAIYFKGDWAQKFKPVNTEIQPFYKLDGDLVMVHMMKSLMKGAKYSHNPDLGCKALQLPYKGEDLYMLVLLPDKKDGLPALESKLSVKGLEHFQNHMPHRLVEVSLPKFKIEASFELSEALSKLGMPDAFDMTKADFSGMTKQNDIYLSKVFHKAFIEVNEEGTEAAAATGAVLMTKSTPVKHSFDANHPFLFLIMDKRSGVILFQGRLVNPTAIETKQGHEVLYQETDDAVTSCSILLYHYTLLCIFLEYLLTHFCTV